MGDISRWPSVGTAGGEGLGALGCGDIEPGGVQKLDSIAALDDLQRIGKAVPFKASTATTSTSELSMPVRLTRASAWKRQPTGARVARRL